MSDQVDSRLGRVVRVWPGGQRGQALVETALVVPMLLLLAFGVVGIGRLVQAQMGVSAVAREAARAAALADEPVQATLDGLARGEEVATGYRLTNGSLGISIDSGSLVRGGQVRAGVSYEVALDDLPLLGWARFSVSSDHLERTDPYRSHWPTGG